jgi:hypothetical protein
VVVVVVVVEVVLYVDYLMVLRISRAAIFNRCAAENREENVSGE